MVALTRSLLSVTKCLEPSSAVYTRASASSSLQARRRAIGHDASTSSPKATRVKKKFSELPTAFLLPDGTEATSLGEWWGGVDAPLLPRLVELPVINKVPDDSIPIKRRAQKKTSELLPKPLASQSDSQPSGSLFLSAVASEKPKRRRTRKIEASAEIISGDEAINEVLDNITPRRHKVGARATDLLLEPISAPEGLSFDSEATPKKPKRRIRKTEITEKIITDTIQPKKRARKKASAEESLVSPENQIVASDSVASKAAEPRGLLAKEILHNLQKFPHCLLLTRVGQFYESYFDQATEIARLLGIKLTSRKWNGSRIPMCGFPLMHIDKHLKVLVQQNKRFVAMCEEFPRFTRSGVKEFDRRVVRIITPGTLIDEPFLNPYENNYVLAVSTPLEPLSESVDSHDMNKSLGLAWMDVSTGEFFTKTCSQDGLTDELARIGPREVVLNQELHSQSSHPVMIALAEENSFISYISPLDSHFLPNDGLDEAATSKIEENNDNQNGDDELAVMVEPTFQPSHRLTEEDPTNTSSASTYPLTREETSAVGLLTTFLHANLLEHMPALTVPNREGTKHRMQIDSHTIKALEIREGIYEGGTKGSLLSVIKRTSTTGGTRLLARWLCSPSTSITEINARQALVAFFYNRPHFRIDLVGVLTEADDITRIVQKFLLGRGDSSDLLALNRTIRVWSTMKKRIDNEKRFESGELHEFHQGDWDVLETLVSRMANMKKLSARISSALESNIANLDQSVALEDEQPGNEGGEVVLDTPTSEPPLLSWKYNYDKWTIKPEFSKTLATLHATLQELLERKDDLERDLQLKYDAPSLTLRSSPGQGTHIHLARAKRDQHRLNTDPLFISISESNTTKCYFYQEWARLGNHISETTLLLAEEEKKTFDLLRSEVNSFSSDLRRNAHILDELDVVLGFANLATELNFTRPTITDGTEYNVDNGRHPAVELGLLTASRVFTPNSVKMSPTSMFHVITGPNMAGKSTLLRQTALITILAQIGSFIPAESATIGIVDKLFSRIGAKDDLFRDRSTFMVEMLETADILRRATSKSLVIMDEVGRGTTVTDGLAITFATVHHLVTVNNCRSLFATHFHELSDMLGYSATNSTGHGIFDRVRFYCTDVDEIDDNHFAYSYRLRPGVNRDSHGLKVAQLAGMPPAAVVVAKNTISWLKNNKHDTSNSDANAYMRWGQFPNSL